MFAFIRSDVGNGREYIGTVSGRSLDAVSVVYSSLPSLVINVEILKVVIEVDGTCAQVASKEGRMCSEDCGDIDMTLAAEGNCKTGLPFMEVCDDGCGQLSSDILKTMV